jgi:hypothetical protein
MTRKGHRPPGNGWVDDSKPTEDEEDSPDLDYRRRRDVALAFS